MNYEIETFMGYTIVRFEEKPSEYVRERLKRLGMKFAAYQREWVGKANADSVRRILEDAEKRAEMAHRFRKKANTICWNCKRAPSGGCPWFSSDEPVDGWDATVGTVNMQHICNGKPYPKKIKSYTVNACPLFMGGFGRPEKAYAWYAKNLAAAIVAQAVKDLNAIETGSDISGESRSTLKTFFRSRWCGELLVNTGIDQDVLCEKLGV